MQESKTFPRVDINTVYMYFLIFIGVAAFFVISYQTLVGQEPSQILTGYVGTIIGYAIHQRGVTQGTGTQEIVNGGTTK